jgi:cell division FtsZ-interacting protein ZapD
VNTCTCDCPSSFTGWTYVGNSKGQSQVHVWISGIRPIKHAGILPAHVHPVKELGQSQVHVFTSSIPPLRHICNMFTDIHIISH